MGIEIERKYLINSDAWRGASHKSTRLRQGYLSTDADRNVRVRLKGDRGLLTIKGRGQGLTRQEFEYEIPANDVEQILESLCLDSPIDKTRYELRHGGLLWEIDEFYGANAGLIVAEVELESEDQAIDLPDWVGEEVTHDPRYLNANLVARPFTTW